MSRKDVENRVHGVHACRGLFMRRPSDVVRVYITEARIDDFADLLKFCATTKRPYRVLSDEELEKVTESRHHEGICIGAKPRATVELADVLRVPGAARLIALVDVGNPHNVGAILRSAAHFGVRAAMLPAEPPRLSAAAARTAQGGAEWVDIVHEENPGKAVRAARAAGFTIAATSSHAGRDLFDGPLPPRLFLLVGAEDQGLPPEAMAEADLVLRIPGTGHVESLNVAAATAVLLAEHFRQHGRRGAGGAAGPPRKRGPAPR